MTTKLIGTWQRKYVGLKTKILNESRVWSIAKQEGEAGNLMMLDLNEVIIDCI